MDGSVMHMFCNEFFFSTNSHAFSLRISCTYMVRNCNYFTAVFVSFAYRFLQDFNKVVDYYYLLLHCIIIIITDVIC